jgi:hypothetical protein
MAKYKNHPYADLFPMMTAAELDALAADIAENGLRQPVVLYQGAVLDGRNRLLACEKARVEPTFTEHQGDDASALALVISLNVQRRDLTAAQRAIVAARAMPTFERLAEQRQTSGKKLTKGETRRAADDASKAFKVNSTYIFNAKALLAEASELAAHVEDGTTSLATALEQLKKKRDVEERRRLNTALIVKWELWDAVQSEELTFEEALRRAEQAEKKQEQEQAAEKDARSHWLKDLVGFLSWIEHLVAGLGDDHLAWNLEPGAPGSFEHGITSARVALAITQLERIRSIPGLEESNGISSADSEKGSSSSPSTSGRVRPSR